ncbi:MAG: UDP-glucose/GDP-mannose dehydrogenase family protein [Planctomycetes bacterium]|nr:UDP-glucose/GDP-mannose dehydrogenase family protein [Planctomycetota bacterium]
MNVSVFGLGYVGAVTIGCLSRDGVRVVGVDVNPQKAALIASGKSPIHETGLDELLRRGVDSGLITATSSAVVAVAATDVSFVSVGTPSREDGGLDLTYVERVCEEIADAVKEKGRPHVVVLRSTVIPGTTERMQQVLDQRSGGLVAMAYNPEFLREGQAIRDFDAPAFTVIAVATPEAEEALRTIYASVKAPVLVMRFAEAEMVKYVSNAWHATKVVFGNEIGRLASVLAVDGQRVMDAVVQDTKLNISAAYLRPGFPYGGSCLPKDVRALTATAREHGVRVPLLSSLMPSNEAHIAHAVRLVLDHHVRRVGLVGLAFKAGTDDLRESPSIELAERLIGKGCHLRILDDAVRNAWLNGANKKFVDEHLPHLSELLTDADGFLAHAELIVLAHPASRYRDLIARIRPEVPIVNLADFLAPVRPESAAHAHAA